MLSKDDAERAAADLLAAEAKRLHPARDRRRARFAGLVERFWPDLGGFDPSTRHKIIRLGMEQARASLAYRLINVVCFGLCILVFAGRGSIPNWILLAVVPGMLWQLALGRAAIRAAAAQHRAAQLPELVP